MFGGSAEPVLPKTWCFLDGECVCLHVCRVNTYSVLAAEVKPRHWCRSIKLTCDRKLVFRGCGVPLMKACCFHVRSRPGGGSVSELCLSV